MKIALSKFFLFLFAFALLSSAPVKLYATESPSGGSAYFDFEDWRRSALPAYNKFISLLKDKVDDPTWKKVFDDADTTRNVSKNTYLRNVKDATLEEWLGFSQVEIIDYFTTYLTFVSVKDFNHFDMQFKSGEQAKQRFFRYNVGTGMWEGNGSKELMDAYMTVADYQLQYFEHYNFPYNFHNDKSYAEELGFSTAVEKPKLPDSENDASENIGETAVASESNSESSTANESEKSSANSSSFNSEVKTSENSSEATSLVDQSKSIWSMVLDKLKGTWLTILILIVTAIGFFVVKWKISKKNIDDMSESGK